MQRSGDRERKVQTGGRRCREETTFTELTESQESLRTLDPEGGRKLLRSQSFSRLQAFRSALDSLAKTIETNQQTITGYVIR